MSEQPKVEQWISDALDDLYQAGYLYLGLRDRPKPKEFAALIIARHAPHAADAEAVTELIRLNQLLLAIPIMGLVDSDDDDQNLVRVGLRAGLVKRIRAALSRLAAERKE